MPCGLFDIGAPDGAALLALFGVLLTLLVGGIRAERERRRVLHARALAAVIAYGEMPFMIRRRRCEMDERSAERVRLSTRFSEIQAEIGTCQVLLGADGYAGLAARYEALVAVARRVVGGEARRAWTEEPISTDAEMNMPELFERLSEYREAQEDFKSHLAAATVPRWRRAVDAVRARRRAARSR
jgi:hypothetical protein